MNDGVAVGDVAGARNVMNTEQFNAVVPAAFPHQRTSVNTIPSTPTSFPHANTSILQGAPSITTERTKGQVYSGDLVSISLTPAQWQTQNFHNLLVPGELLFSRKEQEHGKYPLASLAQLNIMLADGYRHLEVELNTYLTKGKSPAGYNTLDRVAKYYQRYKEQGEVALLDNDPDDPIYEQIGTDVLLQRLMYVSLKHIVNRWTLQGLYIARMAGDARANKTLTVGIKGYADSTPVKNYWGDNLAPGQNLFLILRRHKDEERSTAKRTVYTHFELVPWASFDMCPSTADLYYEDDAGIARQGIAIMVGRVIFSPERKYEPGLAKLMLGQNTTAEQASAAARNSTSVVVTDLGTPAHRVGLF